MKCPQSLVVVQLNTHESHDREMQLKASELKCWWIMRLELVLNVHCTYTVIILFCFIVLCVRCMRKPKYHYPSTSIVILLEGLFIYMKRHQIDCMSDLNLNNSISRKNFQYIIQI